MARIEIRVQPRASKNEIVVDPASDLIRVRVTAPPEDSKANDAVVRLLAKTLGVPRSTVRVALGHRSRSKTIEIDDLSKDEIRKLIRASLRKARKEP